MRPHPLCRESGGCGQGRCQERSKLRHRTLGKEPGDGCHTRSDDLIRHGGRPVVLSLSRIDNQGVRVSRRVAQNCNPRGQDRSREMKHCLIFLMLGSGLTISMSDMTSLANITVCAANYSGAESDGILGEPVS